MITKVGDYSLVDEGGLWFLMKDHRIVSTLVDMGGGTWRARTPKGNAVTLDVPDEVEEPATWVAEQITR